MIRQTLITIVFIKISAGNYLQTIDDHDINKRPKIENGVYIRQHKGDVLENTKKIGNFIFRENSQNVENLLQNNFDPFGPTFAQDAPFVSEYVDRAKRSNKIIQQRSRKSLKLCKGKSCGSEHYYGYEEKANSAKRNLIPTIEPINTVANNKIIDNELKNYIDLFENNVTDPKVIQQANKEKEIINEVTTEHKINDSETNCTGSKRNTKCNPESAAMKRTRPTELLNKSHETIDRLKDRNAIHENSVIWHNNAVSQSNIYKVLPKNSSTNKPVTEKGLVKVIAMLTKTFQKIMKQHSDIKEIHEKLSKINDEFLKNVATITTKFADFDLKYLYLTKFQEKLKLFEARLTAKQQYFANKEMAISKRFQNFEDQQRKFLLQQQQFYNIQKLILAQNEKINLKQSLVAKTQSEISHRQNNFARILKKAKQLYIDNKYPKFVTASPKIKEDKQHDDRNYKNVIAQISSSTIQPISESVKINLFPIPTSNKLEDHDDLILLEKDEKPIDDLVYKYYFNNSFIDNIMRNHVLNIFNRHSDSSENNFTLKNKRNEDLKPTLLFPTAEMNDVEIHENNRPRRWINHHSRHKNKRRNRGKGETTFVPMNDEKPKKNIIMESKPAYFGMYKKNIDHLKTEPFLKMATSFCNEIRKNLNTTSLNLCIEKTLRRLAFMYPHKNLISTVTPVSRTTVDKSKIQETTVVTSTVPPAPKKSIIETTGNITQQNNPTLIRQPPWRSGLVPPSPSTQTSPPVTTHITPTSYPPTEDFKLNFPDNDALEMNLKQFVITPDTEGNVYYDGSVHSSKLLGSDSGSAGVDDIIPGFESNSKMDTDIYTLGSKARRRAYLKTLNQKLKMSLG